MRDRLEEEVSTNQDLRAYIRKVAGCKGKPYIILVVDGDNPPTHHGRPNYYMGKGYFARLDTAGDSLASYGGKRYRSTRRIEVGIDWLLEVVMKRTYLEKNDGKTEEEN